jgi:hypothetical protein
MMDVIREALMITSFVFVMMLAIEYVTVLSRGDWEKKLLGSWWKQNLLAALLGALPGCLGSFAVVSLYSHRVITFGALTAAMIATCGDESFVMLARFPGKAIMVFGILFVVGFATGAVVDLLLRARRTSRGTELETYVPVHEEERCVCFNRQELLAQWKHCTPQRGVMTVFLGLYLLAVATGEIGPEHWNWIRITLIGTAAAGLFIVASVPEHFLKEHLWDHVARVHIWRVFLWTLGAMTALHILVSRMDIEGWISGSGLTVLVAVCLVGLIPQSGPHLVFITLYADGMLPFSILLASCIVQNGHGMLPVLAHSRRAFVAVKAVGFTVGLAVGLIGLANGW